MALRVLSLEGRKAFDRFLKSTVRVININIKFLRVLCYLICLPRTNCYLKLKSNYE